MDPCRRTAEKAVPAASSMDVSETVAESPMPAPKGHLPGREIGPPHSTPHHTCSVHEPARAQQQGCQLGTCSLSICSIETKLTLGMLQGKVQRMRPSPFHKGSGEGTAAAAAPKRPAAAAKKPAARSRKVVSEVTTLVHCSSCVQCLARRCTCQTYPLAAAAGCCSCCLLQFVTVQHTYHGLRSLPDWAFHDHPCGCSCSLTTMTNRKWRRQQHQCRQQLQAVHGGRWPPNPMRSQSRRMRATTLILQSPHETAPCNLAFQRKKHQAASRCNT